MGERISAIYSTKDTEEAIREYFKKSSVGNSCRYLRETMKSEVNFEHHSEAYWQVRRTRSGKIDEEFAFCGGCYRLLGIA